MKTTHTLSLVNHPGAHHDHAYVQHKFATAQDQLREVDRRISGHLFRHGVRRTAWVRCRWLYRQANLDAQKQIHAHDENGGW